MQNKYQVDGLPPQQSEGLFSVDRIPKFICLQVGCFSLQFADKSSFVIFSVLTFIQIY